MQLFDMSRYNQQFLKSTGEAFQDLTSSGTYHLSEHAPNSYRVDRQTSNISGHILQSSVSQHRYIVANYQQSQGSCFLSLFRIDHNFSVTRLSANQPVDSFGRPHAEPVIIHSDVPAYLERLHTVDKLEGPDRHEDVQEAIFCIPSSYDLIIGDVLQEGSTCYKISKVLPWSNNILQVFATLIA